ncbi:MAG TPA: LysM domain-containing protein, partial [Kofleriaceae bacterium]|nr:LysM domain-containing protein [Kofleriaceae bacterium]
MRRARAAVVVLLALVALVAGARRARADRDYIVHTVQAGDSLELLAAEYYGDRHHAIFIMVANHMDHPRPLRPGEKLRVPVTREVTAAVGDTFEGLAQAYLGDKRRAEFLAEFNGMTVDDGLPAGTVLTVPFHVVHTAAGNETLDAIAAAYFGDSKNAGLLKRYNFLDHDVLAPKETIVIPIRHVKVRESALPPVDAESRARTEKRKATEAAAAGALPLAKAAWRAGDAAEVRRGLIGLDLDFLATDRAVEIGMLLGAAYVALGDDDSARAAFHRAIERRPTAVMQAYWYSPRVRDLWKKAGGQVEADPPPAGAGAA